MYIYTLEEKQRNRSHRIINLFPSCYAFLKFPKTRKKINRTFSDLFDKKKLEFIALYYCYIELFTRKI